MKYLVYALFAPIMLQFFITATGVQTKAVNDPNVAFKVEFTKHEGLAQN